MAKFKNPGIRFGELGKESLQSKYKDHIMEYCNKFNIESYMEYNCFYSFRTNNCKIELLFRPINDDNDTLFTAKCFKDGVLICNVFVEYDVSSKEYLEHSPTEIGETLVKKQLEYDMRIRKKHIDESVWIYNFLNRFNQYNATINKCISRDDRYKYYYQIPIDDNVLNFYFDFDGFNDKSMVNLTFIVTKTDSSEMLTYTNITFMNEQDKMLDKLRTFYERIKNN